MVKSVLNSLNKCERKIITLYKSVHSTCCLHVHVQWFVFLFVGIGYTHIIIVAIIR